jgi:hypothetical protein
MARFLRGITGAPSAWHPLRLRSLLIFVYSDPEVDCGIFKHTPIFVVCSWITYEFSIFYPLQDDDESVPTLAVMAYPKLLMMWGWFIFAGPRKPGPTCTNLSMPSGYLLHSHGKWPGRVRCFTACATILISCSKLWKITKGECIIHPLVIIYENPLVNIPIDTSIGVC